MALSRAREQLETDPHPSDGGRLAQSYQREEQGLHKCSYVLPFSSCWTVPTHTMVSLSLNRHCFGETLLGRWIGTAPQSILQQEPALETLRFPPVANTSLCALVRISRLWREILKASKEVQVHR